MKFRPLHDRVLVERLGGEEKSKGGIVIPDTAQEKPLQGLVLAAGPGRIDENGKLRPLEIRKGDRVLFGKYAGTEIRIDGNDRLILREEDILAVLD